MPLYFRTSTTDFKIRTLSVDGSSESLTQGTEDRTGPEYITAQCRYVQQTTYLAAILLLQGIEHSDVVGSSHLADEKQHGCNIRPSISGFWYTSMATTWLRSFLQQAYTTYCCILRNCSNCIYSLQIVRFIVFTQDLKLIYTHKQLL